MQRQSYTADRLHRFAFVAIAPALRNTHLSAASGLPRQSSRPTLRRPPLRAASMPPSGPPAAETTPLLPLGAVAVQVASPTPDPVPDDTHYMSRAIDWGRLFKFIGPYLIPQTLRLRMFAVMSMLFIVLSKFCILLPPYALKLAVDTLAGNALLPPNERVTPLFAVGLFFAGRTLGSMFNALRSITYAMVSTANTKRFSVNIFRHLQLLDLEYHIKRKTGEVNRIMDRGADSIDTLMNVVLFTLAPTYVVFVTPLFLRGDAGEFSLVFIFSLAGFLKRLSSPPSFCISAPHLLPLLSFCPCWLMVGTQSP